MTCLREHASYESLLNEVLGDEERMQRTNNKRMHAINGNIDGAAEMAARKHNREMHAMNGNMDPLKAALEDASRDDQGAGDGKEVVKGSAPEERTLEKVPEWGKCVITLDGQDRNNLPAALASGTPRVEFTEGGDVSYVGLGPVQDWWLIAYRDDTPATVGCTPNTWHVAAIGKSGRGPEVVLSSIMQVGAEVVNGAALRELASALRMNLTQVVGNTAINAITAIGSDLTNGRGTSTADICFKLHAYALCSLGMTTAGDSLVANTFLVPANPVAVDTDATLRTWPNGPVGVVAGALPANTVEAVVTNLNDFYGVYGGFSTAVAGFEPTNWGGQGTDGVAVVPVRQSDLTQGVENAWWTFGFMDYPIKIMRICGNVEDIGGNTLFAAANGCARPALQCLHLPGPTRKVIFVLVDVQNGAPPDVTFGRGGAAVQVTAAANSLVGGAAIDLSAAVSDMVGANFGNWPEELQTTCARWFNIYGNEDDWNTTRVMLANYFAFRSAGPTRRQNGGEALFWNDENGAPFTENGVGYAAPTAAQIALFPSTVVDACGVRTSGVQNQSNTSPCAVLSSHDPAIATLLASRFCGYTRNLGTQYGERMSQLWLQTWADSNRLTQACDLLYQKFGIGARELFAAGSLGVTNIAISMLRHAVPYIHELVRSVGCSGWKPLFGINETANAGWRTIYANAEALPVSRVHPVNQMLCCTSGERYPEDTFLTMTKYGYQVRNANITGAALNWDVLGSTDVIALQSEENARNVRHLLCTGGFSRALVDISGLGQLDSGGGNGRSVSVRFWHPTAARSVERQQRLFVNYAAASDIREIVTPDTPVGIDSQTGARKMRLALTGGRQVTAGKGTFLPLFVPLVRRMTVSDTPTADDDTANLEDIFQGGNTFRD
jgi:hypothetical protein